MGISEQEIMEIQKMNEELAKINFKCEGLDIRKMNLFFEYFGNINVAKYLASQQISPYLVSLINMMDDGENIIPNDRSIITLFDICSYYNIDMEYLNEVLRGCNYNTNSDKFLAFLHKLKDYYKECMEVAPVVSLANSQRKTNRSLYKKKEENLFDVARKYNIPFVRLYETFLKHGDVTKAVQEIKLADLERDMMAKYQMVIDPSYTLAFSEYKRYFSYMKEQDAIKGRLYSGINDDIDGVFLSADEFEKLLLIDARNFNYFQNLVSSSERQFIQELRNKMKDGEVCLSSEEVLNLLSILSQRRFTVYENTKQFMDLLSRESVRDLSSSSETIFSNTNSLDESLGEHFTGEPSEMNEGIKRR